VNLRAFTHMRCAVKIRLTNPSTPAPFRLLSIRAPASGGATDFFLASALFGHRPTLRSTGEEDARCVQPTSATQTTCVHPHLAHSRLALAGCPAGRPHGVLGSVRQLVHGVSAVAIASRDRTFHDVRDRFGGSSSRANLSISASRPGLESVGVFFPRHACDRASDTPVAYRVHRHASPGFPGAAFPGRASLFWRGWHGSDDARAAETTLHAAS